MLACLLPWAGVTGKSGSEFHNCSVTQRGIPQTPVLHTGVFLSGPGSLGAVIVGVLQQLRDEANVFGVEIFGKTDSQRISSERREKQGQMGRHTR